MIYLDNNATTRVADEVVTAMTPFYRELYGNPHAIHSLGRRSHDAVEDSRAEVAALLGCDPAEVIFTSCGTEGNALVLRGLTDRHPERKKVVTTAVEHPSVLLLLRSLETAGVIELAIIPVSTDGEIDLDAMRNAIHDQTLLVSVMLAQNETGVLHPVARIAEMAHARGALMHVDAVQAAGKVPLSKHDLSPSPATSSTPPKASAHSPSAAASSSRPSGSGADRSSAFAPEPSPFPRSSASPPPHASPSTPSRPTNASAPCATSSSPPS
jgi:cysteine desulfurase